MISETDWVYLTYKLHNDIENMLVPEARTPKSNHNWIFYTAYALYKLYSFKSTVSSSL